MMNVLRGTQGTRQLPHAGSGKRAGRPARREGLSVGPNGRRGTGRGGGRLPLFQRRTWGVEDRCEGGWRLWCFPQCPQHTLGQDSHSSRAMEAQWSGEGQGSRMGWGRALGLDSSRASMCPPQELPCPSEHGQEAAITW